MAISMWADWKRYGMGGNWLDQPLALLAQIRMINIVDDTYAKKNTKDFDWSNLTPTQHGIIRWLDNG